MEHTHIHHMIISYTYIVDAPRCDPVVGFVGIEPFLQVQQFCKLVSCDVYTHFWTLNLNSNILDVRVAGAGGMGVGHRSEFF